MTGLVETMGQRVGHIGISSAGVEMIMEAHVGHWGRGDMGG